LHLYGFRVLKSASFKHEQVEHLYNSNLELLAAFRKRKEEGGVELSDWVWENTRQTIQVCP